MNSEVSAVRAELSALKVLVLRLEARVAELEARLEGFEVVPPVGESASPVRPTSSAGEPATPASQPAAGGSATATVLSRDIVFSDGSCAASPGAPASAFRTALAQQVGRFLRACLEGGHRKSSGRDLLDLQSRYYIVVREYSGVVHDPPRIFTAFGKVKPLCFRGSDKGDSVFVGLPSQAEVRVALGAAGLLCPAGSLDA